MLPSLPLGTQGCSGEVVRIAAALRAAAAAAMGRHSSALRRAAVAQWEVRLRVNDHSGAWRLVVSLPTGTVYSDLTSSVCYLLEMDTCHTTRLACFES